MDEATLVALRLGKEWHISPMAVLDMPTDKVLDALQYVTFIGDYEQTQHVLNTPKK